MRLHKRRALASRNPISTRIKKALQLAYSSAYAAAQHTILRYRSNNVSGVLLLLSPKNPVDFAYSLKRRVPRDAGIATLSSEGILMAQQRVLMVLSPLHSIDGGSARPTRRLLSI